MRTVITDGAEETQELAARLGALVEKGDVIALVGPLGAGKTAFVQGLARGLGVREARVASPTFNILLEYRGRLTLHHLDLYRLGDESELIEIGFDHYLYGEGVCAVEWMDKFPSRAPADHLRVAIAFDPAAARRRTLSVEGTGPRGRALVEKWLGGGGGEKP